ncbi:NADPH-dependent FMN reductase [uncultured Desulfovibrio sp.]|uniref:NADPH-dependent FMN reductase n=1 Tax=uncultured Desulfovibrio sp. TaxID=167968 RepID=UPI0025E748DA|nr:NADPH-dependent FMN reductase [uncultured Desulfovibrio sp.]
MDELVFLGVCGSLRRASRNRGLLRKARELMPAGSRLDIADISALPFFNEDIPKPESVRRLVGLAENADGFLFASPEYNYSLAPALKNALDWLSREPGLKPFSGKPAAIVGAGGGMGTARSQNHLRQVCVYLDLHLLNTPEFFSNAFSPAFDTAGDLVDAELEKRLAALLQGLVDWAQVLKKGRA